MKSDALNVISGVPQGSILGPLLFIIYVNDLAFTCPSSNLELYADDTTLYKSGFNIQEIETNLQESLNVITKWCEINNMLIHPMKSKCMLVGSKFKLRNAKELKLVINDSFLENVTSQKILGVHVENTLTWHVQIDYVCKQMNSRINLFKKIKHYLNDRSRMLFYNAYILPIMDYCCHIWGKGNNTYINKINKLQRRICKVMLDWTFKTKSTNIYDNLQILQFNNRCMYHTAILIYKILNSMAPSYLSDLVTVSNNVSYNLRSKSHRDIVLFSTPRTNYLKDTFKFNGMKIWNSIPYNIRNCNNISSFKTSYKKYLFESQKLL